MKTLKIQVEVPATQTSLFAARKTAGMIIDGLDTADRFDAKYDVNAIQEFAMNLRGAAGTYTFDVTLDLVKEEEEEIMKEIIDSLPATHKIIEAAPVATTAPVTTKEDATAFFERVKAIEPAIGGSIENGIIKGAYRGKASQSYAYSFDEHKFLFNKAGEIISSAFEKAKNNS